MRSDAPEEATQTALSRAIRNSESRLACANRLHCETLQAIAALLSAILVS